MSIARLLLGKDREAAWTYIQNWRTMMSGVIRFQWAQILDGEKHLYGEKSFAAERNADLESEEELTEVEVEIEPLSSESESESPGSGEDSEVDEDADIEDEEMADDIDDEHDMEDGHSYIEDDEMADDE